MHFYRAADVFVYPSFNETFGLPILEAMACGLPRGDLGHQRDARDGRRGRPAGRPARPRVDRRRDRRGLRPGGGAAASRGSAGPASSTGRATAERTLEVYREVYARQHEEGPTMRILVTGGAGFIGSHTCDRLVELGHDVVVLDALTAPVHRDGKPNYLTPGAELFVGTSATATCSPTCCGGSTPSTTSRPTRTTCPTSPGSPTST